MQMTSPLDHRRAHYAPPQSLEQRRAALERANVIRSARAAWKKQVKRCEVDPLDVFCEPPAEFESMKVFDVLLALPKVGRVKANKVLRLAQVSPSKTVGGLTPRQRVELLSILRRYEVVR